MRDGGEVLRLNARRRWVEMLRWEGRWGREKMKEVEEGGRDDIGQVLVVRVSLLIK